FEFDYVTILNPPLTADPVHNFVIERDANVPRKNAMAQPIAEKRALYLRVSHEISGRFIYFLRRDSGTNQFAHPVENVARRATRLPHLLNFFCALDWNHAGTFSSIKRDISVNTVSRSRFPSIRRKIDIFP